MSEYANHLMQAICEKLQLQTYLYQQAEKRYHAIADLLHADELLRKVNLNIYPQGSFRLKTTVKPLNYNEYDLDFVAEIDEQTSLGPNELYTRIYNVLNNNGKYRGKLEKKSRCIRINYANEFHLDIMPGKKIAADSNELLVPDKKLLSWFHHSNPKAYAEWFEKNARTVILQEAMELRKIKHSTEPISDQEVTEKLEPLRKAVQLVKRYRDIYCDIQGGEPVRSIVICTLMGEINSAYSNTIMVLSDFCDYVNSLIAINAKPFQVKNPTVDECLTEKWEDAPQIYISFKKMMKALTKDVCCLRNLYDFDEICNKLKQMFGESVVSVVLEEKALEIEAAHKNGSLSVNRNGQLLLNSQNGIRLEPNTFYGN